MHILGQFCNLVGNGTVYGRGVHAVKMHLYASYTSMSKNCQLTQKRSKSSVSSERWLRRQKDDPHTKEAKKQHYRSRAAYKLIELDHKFLLFKRNTLRIVDLGFAPGAWTQVAMQRMTQLGQKPKILGVDIIPSTPPEGAQFLHGDIFSRKTHQEIQDNFPDNEVDLVMSDMMANTLGIKDNDHLASMELCEGALMLAGSTLRRNGALVMKFYTGREERQLEEKCRKMFKKVHRMKPSACRSELREMYFVCLGRSKELDNHKQLGSSSKNNEGCLSK